MVGPYRRDAPPHGSFQRVAHKYRAEREKMRACFRAGVAVRGADTAARGVPDGGKSPTKTELKERYKREHEEVVDQHEREREEVVEQRKEMHEQLVQEQRQHKCTKNALSSAHSRAKVLRDNLRACLDRERNKAQARGAGDLLAERNAAYALIKNHMTELAELRRWKTCRAAKSDPATLRRLEEERAKLKRENKELSLENYKLGEQKLRDDLDYAEAKQFAETLWLPQRQVGVGAGRGCAHDPLLRKLYMKLLTLRVALSIMNWREDRAHPRGNARWHCDGNRQRIGGSYLY